MLFIDFSSAFNIVWLHDVRNNNVTLNTSTTTNCSRLFRKRHITSTSSSWEPWRKATSLQTSWWTSTTAPSRASWPTVSQSGSGTSLSLTEEHFRRWWKPPTALLELHFLLSMTFTETSQRTPTTQNTYPLPCCPVGGATGVSRQEPHNTKCLNSVWIQDKKTFKLSE